MVSRRLPFIAALVVAASTSAVVTVPAHAGEYLWRSCDADPARRALGWIPSVTLNAKHRATCNWTEATRTRPGLLLFMKRGEIRGRSRAAYTLEAPPGGSFKVFQWLARGYRSDCAYGVVAQASGPNGVRKTLMNLPANKRCGVKQRTKGDYPAGTASDAKRRRRAPLATYDLSGTNQIVQRIGCAQRRCPAPAPGEDVTQLQTLRAMAIVQEFTPPSASIRRDSKFTLGGWVGQQQTLSYDADDQLGISHVRLQAEGGSPAAPPQPRSCDDGKLVERCPRGGGAFTVDTRALREGAQTLTLEVRDGADNPAYDQVRVQVDNKAPLPTPLQLVGGEGWRSGDTFRLAWLNGPEDSPQGAGGHGAAPIAAAYYKLCPEAGGPCLPAQRVAGQNVSQVDVKVPAPGSWTAVVWREDDAGNQDPQNASQAVNLRSDPEAPTPVFEPGDQADPTQVSVLVSDRYSGLADGRIEISRAGSSSWQALDTSVHGERLLARIDDATMPAGAYLLRTTVWDRTGNQASTDRSVTGQLMLLQLPLRAETVLRGGIAHHKWIRRTIRRGGKRRRTVVLTSSRRVRQGHTVRITGSLEARDGRAIAGAPVQVYLRTPISPDQQVAVVTTDARGRYSYTTRATSSGILRLLYAGSPLTLPVQRELALHVPARGTLRPSRKRISNGQSITFRGRLATVPAPAIGKLIELQVRVCRRADARRRCLAHEWQTFRTIRSNPAGHWRTRYTFGRASCSSGPLCWVRYKIRARVPDEAGYPYAAGGSRPVSVAVRARR